MAENSKIEWTDHTFNPWVGCDEVSPGCDNCYARAWAIRTGHPELWQGERRRTKTWGDPVKWNKEAAQLGIRYKVFCASLADICDNVVPQEWREDLWELVDETPHLDWLLLTKRVGNFQKMMPDRWRDGLPAHVAIGATICNQPEADRDIWKLLLIKARIHFLSMEPLLGPVCLRNVAGRLDWMPTEHDRLDPLHPNLSKRIDWVIVGGESGAQARPMQPEWVRSLRDQCFAAGVAFHFKQWGEFAPKWYNDDAGNKIPGSEWIDRMGRRVTGRELDGRTWDDFPK